MKCKSGVKNVKAYFRPVVVTIFTAHCIGASGCKKRKQVGLRTLLCVALVLLIQCQNFSESLERDLSNDVLKSTISSGEFFGLGPWATYHAWYSQIGKYFHLSNTNFDDTI